jgi:predicted alpha/beta superfamily hydrolase
MNAQTAVTFGQRYEMHSDILGEDRVLNVLLPAEYTDSTANDYSVIYLLDGAVGEDFFHAAGLLRYFDDHGMMPPTILVGIVNVDRKRDFTYPSNDPRDQRDFPTTGGSAKFIDFLQNELPAFVEKTFRTTKHRTLIGQSLGGLLATEVLLKYPGHFNDYIIVSPSLWWDKESLYNDMDSLVNTLEASPDRLFVSVGVEYPVMIDGSRKLARLMEGKTQAIFEPLMDEDHNTILHEALYRAFDKLYDPTVLRPYQFANAWNGLNMRSGPSLDSAVVGKLAYGSTLGVISAEEGNEAVIDGLQGQWVYIGSDLGRGWVFDAYVSPVPVFEKGETVKDFAERRLILLDTTVYRNQSDHESSAHQQTIMKDSQGNQYIYHQFWEGCATELRLMGWTGSQRMVAASNYLRGMELPEALIKELKESNGLGRYAPPKLQKDGKYLSIWFDDDGALSIYRACDGVE